MAPQLVGSALSLGLGAAQIGKSNRAKSAADSQRLPMEDPSQVNFLNDIRRRRRAIETGSDPMTKYNISEARRLGRNAMRHNTANAGSPGATIAANIAAQAQTGRNINNAIATGRQQLPFFLNTEQRMIGDIAQRKLDISTYNRAQKMAEWAQFNKMGTANIMAGIAGLVPSNIPESGGELRQTGAEREVVPMMQGRRTTSIPGAGSMRKTPLGVHQPSMMQARRITSIPPNNVGPRTPLSRQMPFFSHNLYRDPVGPRAF